VDTSGLFVSLQRAREQDPTKNAQQAKPAAKDAELIDRELYGDVAPEVPMETETVKEEPVELRYFCVVCRQNGYFDVL